MRDSCGNSGTAETPQERQRRGGSAPAPRQRRHRECDRREAETDVALVPLGESEHLQRKSTLTFRAKYKGG